MEINTLTEQEKAELLNKSKTELTPPLYYKFSDYKYNTNCKDRVLSGIRDLDYLTKGFELGCITIWTGQTNCLDKDTEFFNGEEWKKISEFKMGERVLQYNLDGTAELVLPQQYIKKKCDYFKKFENKVLDFVATEDHNMVYVTKSGRGKIVKKKLKELIELHDKSKHGFTGKIITSFNFSGCGIDLTDDEIRVMVMVICDGNFRFSNSDNCYVHLKKERKKERARQLLAKSNIEFYEYKAKNGYSTFRFKAPLLTKTFPKNWYNATKRQFEIIVDECVNWDGTTSSNSYRFSSNVKENADFIQFAVTSTGKRANIEVYNRIGKKYKENYKRQSLEYTINFSKRENTLVGFENPREKQKFIDYKSVDGYCYCFTVPSGMIVIRRNGKIMIIGNCGKTTVMTMITKQTILQGEKVFYFNGEQTKDDFKNNLYKQTVDKKDIYSKQFMQKGKETCVFDYFVKDEQIPKLDKLYGENLIVYNNNAKRTIDFLIRAMEEVRQKYGVRVFMLDNFMQIDTTSSDEYREQKDIMEKLRTFAVNKNVHIHLVAHPRKIDKMQTRITIYDVLGSSNLVNKAYNVISIIRVDTMDKENTEYKRLQKQMFEEGYDITQTSSILEVLKTKGIRCGLVGLKYDSITKTFTGQPQMTSEVREKMKHQTQQQTEIDEMPF